MQLDERRAKAFRSGWVRITMTGFAFSAQGILGAWALPLRYKKLEMRMFGRVRPHVAVVLYTWMEEEDAKLRRQQLNAGFPRDKRKYSPLCYSGLPRLTSMQIASDMSTQTGLRKIAWIASACNESQTTGSERRSCESRIASPA